MMLKIPLHLSQVDAIDRVVTQLHNIGMYPSDKEKIQHCIDGGGYIAGGAAVAVARHALGIPMMRYFFTDVDVFFRNPQDAAAVICSFKTVPSFGGNACVIQHTNPQVQLINTFFGEPEERVNDFDFLNAAVFLHEDHVYVPEGWEELERKNTLHIQNDKSQFLFSRVRKYLTIKGYTSFSEQTGDILIRHASEKIAQYLNLGVQERQFAQNAKVRSAYHGALKIFSHRPLVKRLAVEQLVRIAPFFMHEKELSYNIPFRELSQRMMSAT